MCVLSGCSCVFCVSIRLLVCVLCVCVSPFASVFCVCAPIRFFVRFVCISAQMNFLQKQRLLGRCIHTATPTIESLVARIETLSANRRRSELKATCPSLFSLLVGPGKLGPCLTAIQASGRGMLFYNELFQYAFENRGEMSADQLSVFVYECGRHGLRCRHFVDKLGLATRSYGTKNLLLIYQGICQFSGEYSEFVKSTVGEIEFAKLTPRELLLVLRVIRPLGERSTAFTNLVTHLEKGPEDFSLVEKLQLIYLLKSNKKFYLLNNTKVINLVQRLVGSVAEASDWSDLIVTDITDALDALASLKKFVIVDENLMKVLMNFLINKTAEIRYSPICGLWQSITDSLGHLRYFSGPWMRFVDEICSSPFILKSFASFQLVFFASSLGRLNFYSPQIYTAIADAIVTDIDSINDADMLATLLLPFERAGHQNAEALVAAVLKKVTQISTKNGTDRNTIRGALSCVHSALCLSDNLAHTTQNIMETILPRITRQNVLTNDYSRIFRIDAILTNRQQRGISATLPKWIQSHQDYAWAENTQEHKKLVELEKSRLQNSRPGPSQADFETQDGTLVIVNDAKAAMYMWKHPNEDKNYELEPICMSGRIIMLKRIIGVENTRIINQF